nr:hypothetical protein GCM10025730_40200 [Promicromonospora thailandica]
MVGVRRHARVLASGALALGLAGGAVTPAAAETAREPAGHGPVPVVYDSDLDFDDAATLLYLCQADKQGLVDLRAVTVVNNGVGTPAAPSRTHGPSWTAAACRTCRSPTVPSSGSTSRRRRRACCSSRC